MLGHENIAYSPWLILPPPSHPIAKFREVTQQLVFNSCLVHTGLFFYFARKVFYRREQNELSNALSARDPDESSAVPSPSRTYSSHENKGNNRWRITHRSIPISKQFPLWLVAVAVVAHQCLLLWSGSQRAHSPYCHCSIALHSLTASGWPLPAGPTVCVGNPV